LSRRIGPIGWWPDWWFRWRNYRRWWFRRYFLFILHLRLKRHFWIDKGIRIICFWLSVFGVLS
jgi:hypothetical protein